MDAMCRDALPGLETPVTAAVVGLVGPHGGGDMAVSTPTEPQAFPAQTQLAVSGAGLQLDAHAVPAEAAQGSTAYAEPAEEAEGHAVPAEEDYSTHAEPAEEAEGHAVPAEEDYSTHAEPAEEAEGHAVPAEEADGNNAQSGVTNAIRESDRSVPYFANFLTSVCLCVLIT